MINKEYISKLVDIDNKLEEYINEIKNKSHDARTQEEKLDLYEYYYKDIIDNKVERNLDLSKKLYEDTKRPSIFEGTELSKEILDAKIVDFDDSIIFHFNTTNDPCQKVRMITFMNTFIKNNPDYSYEQNTRIVNGESYITFKINRNGITETSNTIN